MTRWGYNERLEPLPDDLTVMLVVALCDREMVALGRCGPYAAPGIPAALVAWRAGISGARRLGNGAVKGTWSGGMAPALRIAPRLRSLAERGLLRRYRGERSINEYDVSQAGWAWLQDTLDEASP